MENGSKNRIRKYWNSVSAPKREAEKVYRTRWWQSPTIIRHINKTICGDSIDGWNAGAIKLLKEAYEGEIKVALSIGCGEGIKEMALLENNLVQKFICFELADERIRRARQNAEEKEMGDRITFVNADFFETEYVSQKYNMVFWDNSLHHMPNSLLAVQKSYEVLETGGIFFCNDYVGKNKFQWSDMELAIVNGIRASLNDSIFQKDNGKCYSRVVGRTSVEEMDKIDPSEAADSESIIPAIKKTFADPLIIPTGGLIYHLCLNGILSNIEEESLLLQRLLEMDDETIKMGLTQYVFALARK